MRRISYCHNSLVILLLALLCIYRPSCIWASDDLKTVPHQSDSSFDYFNENAMRFNAPVKQQFYADFIKSKNNPVIHLSIKSFSLDTKRNIIEWLKSQGYKPEDTFSRHQQPVLLVKGVYDQYFPIGSDGIEALVDYLHNKSYEDAWIRITSVSVP